MLAGGASLVLAALREAFAGGRKDVPLLLYVPPLSLGVSVGYLLLLMRVVYPALGNVAVHNPVDVALLVSIAGMFMLAAVASAALVSVSVERSGVGERPYRFALYPPALGALAMVVVSVATAVWVLALWA